MEPNEYQQEKIKSMIENRNDNLFTISSIEQITSVIFNFWYTDGTSSLMKIDKQGKIQRVYGKLIYHKIYQM